MFPGGRAYCRPTSDKVRRAILIASEEPLIDGVPAHCACAESPPPTLPPPATISVYLCTCRVRDDLHSKGQDQGKSESRIGRVGSLEKYVYAG